MSESIISRSQTSTLELPVQELKGQAVKEYHAALGNVLDGIDQGTSTPEGEKAILDVANELKKVETKTGGFTIPGTDEWIPGSTHVEYTQVSKDADGNDFTMSYPAELGSRIESFAAARKAASGVATSPADTQKTQPIPSPNGNGRASRTGRPAASGTRTASSRVPRTVVQDVDRAHSMAIVEDETVTNFGITRNKYLELKRNTPDVAEFHGKLADLAKRQAGKLKPNTLVEDINKAREEADIVNDYGISPELYASLVENTLDKDNNRDAEELDNKLKWLKAKHQGIEPGTQGAQGATAEQSAPDSSEEEPKRRFIRARRVAAALGGSILGRNRAATQAGAEDAGLGILEPAADGATVQAQTGAAEQVPLQTTGNTTINQPSVETEEAFLAKTYDITPDEYEQLVDGIMADGNAKDFLAQLNWLSKNQLEVDTSRKEMVKAWFNQQWNNARIFAANPLGSISKIGEYYRDEDNGAERKRNTKIIGAAAVAAALVGVGYLMSRDHSLMSMAADHAPSGHGASSAAGALPGNRAGVDNGNLLQTPTGIGPDADKLNGGLQVGPVPGAGTGNANDINEALNVAAPKQNFDVGAATPWEALHDAGVPDSEILQKIEDGLKASGADYMKHVGNAAGTDTYFGINNADGTLTSYDTASVLKAAGLTQ